MTSPYDGQVVGGVSSGVRFDGYVSDPSTTVQIKALNATTGLFQSVGPPIVSSSVAHTIVDPSVGTVTGYEWTRTQPITATLWQPGPGGGQCAVVTAESGQTRLDTVDSTWSQCTSVNDIATCSSNHIARTSPLARVYTSDWHALNLQNSTLETALISLNAGHSISMTLNNVANLGAFCNASSPGTCPNDTEGYAPQTYAFYHPNGSRLRLGNQVYPFSVLPFRIPPWTGYLAMKSTTVDIQIHDGSLVMDVSFQPTGDFWEPTFGTTTFYLGQMPEVFENCISNWSCGSGLMGVNFSSPHARFVLVPALDRGRISYGVGSASFDAVGADPVLTSKIGAALTTALNDPVTRDAFTGFLTNFFHSVPANHSFVIDSLTVGASGLQIQPSCCIAKPEGAACDNLDNNCDGRVDEGLRNACGVCGPLPTETRDGVDDDCNDVIDDPWQATYVEDYWEAIAEAIGGGGSPPP